MTQILGERVMIGFSKDFSQLGETRYQCKSFESTISAHV